MNSNKNVIKTIQKSLMEKPKKMSHKKNPTITQSLRASKAQLYLSIKTKQTHFPSICN
jgi:hypothetical protein